MKADRLADTDLLLLDDYRRSFAAAYDAVIGALRSQSGLQPTGRFAKSTTSIVEKLRRESIRLSQMQDIAGCRLVVDSLEAQDSTVDQLRSVFRELTLVDRRVAPSHGYIAVHLIVRVESRVVEIQVRTELQHLWAEVSEKLSDLIPEVKYGGGPEQVRAVLDGSSDAISRIELLGNELAELKRDIAELTDRTQTVSGETPEEIRQVLERIDLLEMRHMRDRRLLATKLQELATRLASLRTP